MVKKNIVSNRYFPVYITFPQKIFPKIYNNARAILMKKKRTPRIEAILKGSVE